MITCVNATPLSLKDQAHVLATWLKQSLSFPYEKQGTDASVSILYREPPQRTELAFQKKDGDAAMKTKLGSSLGEERKKELFCIGHGEFTLKSGTDQEHADPFAEMRQKQAQLLAYLRANPALTAAFLEEEGMSDFFKISQESTKEREDRESKRHPLPSTPPTVMGTRLFYLLCYNDQNNIWLLCHGCNITKGSKSTLDWFKEHSRFGAPFLAAINTKGGLHAGLLIDKIYKESPDDYELRMDSGIFRIPHEKNPILGIGEFVVSWYQEHHHSEYETNKVLYEGIDELTKTELDAIRELRNNCQDKAANKRQKYLVEVLQEVTACYVSTLKQQLESSTSQGSDGKSPSSSTSDIVRAESVARAIQEAKSRWHYRYSMKEIRRLIKKSYPNPNDEVSVSTSNTAKSKNLFLSELLNEALDIGNLKTNEVDILLGTIKNLLEGKNELPSRETFKKEFLALAIPASIKITQEAQQEAAKHKKAANDERELRLASQQETATERLLRQEAEQKIAELERQLAAAQNKDRALLASAKSGSAGTVEDNTGVAQSSSSHERQSLKREWRDDFVPKRDEERATHLQKRATLGNVSRTDDEEKQLPEDNPPSLR